MRVSRSLVPSSDGAAAIIRSSGRQVSVACPCHQYQNSSRSRPPVGIPVLSSQLLAELLMAVARVIPSAQRTLPDTVGSFLAHVIFAHRCTVSAEHSGLSQAAWRVNLPRCSPMSTIPVCGHLSLAEGFFSSFAVCSEVTCGCR